jgi:hypothetical protein
MGEEGGCIGFQLICIPQLGNVITTLSYVNIQFNDRCVLGQRSPTIRTSRTTKLTILNPADH